MLDSDVIEFIVGTRINDTLVAPDVPVYMDIRGKGALKVYTHCLCDNRRRYCLRKAHPDLYAHGIK